MQIKADSSPLTVADREGNRIICEALAAIDPHIPIIRYTISCLNLCNVVSMHRLTPNAHAT